MAQQNRRDFFRNTALAGAGLVILSNSRSAYSYAANEGLSFALVGCGGRGAAFLGDKRQYCALQNHGRVVAMCDVNAERAAAGFKKFPDVPKFEDYRVMLDKMAKQVDAVVVATCDHNHAAPSAAAIRAGKHTYCEKGLTRTIHEARALAELAAEHKVVTQEGNNHGYNVRSVEFIRGGTIGDVSAVHMLGGGGGGPRPRPAGTQPVPATLNWDLWLGPALDRPFHRDWMTWGQWRELSSGFMGMWGSHFYPAVFKALKLDTLWPVGKKPPIAGPTTIRVTAEVSELAKDNFPRWAIVHWEIPQREEMPPVRITWYGGSDRDGPVAERWRATIKELFGKYPEFADPADKKWLLWGGHAPKVWVGSKALAYSAGHGCGKRMALLPEEKFKDVANPSEVLPRPLGKSDLTGWCAAIRGGPAPQCNFPEFGGPFTEWTLLANVATLFPDQTLEYDPVGRKVVNLDAANEAVAPEYRKGWSL